MPQRGPFTVADLNVQGELQLKAQYEYDQLQQIPGAADLIGQFSSNLWSAGDEFETNLPGSSALRLRWWSSAPTAGIATLRCNTELTSFSMLATGLDAEADRITLEAFQRHLLRELRDTGYEPAFALMELKERPLVATINFRSPESQTDQLLTALADRCFAAAYFRFKGLA